MTSKGIGDVRRVLGKSKSRTQRFVDDWLSTPKPALPQHPAIHRDALLRFLAERIRATESEVKGDVVEHYEKPTGETIGRHARLVWATMSSYRSAIVQYINAVESGASDEALAELRATLINLARTWKGTHGWMDIWPVFRV